MAGVTKKSKRGRKSVLSSKARRRQEKALDRAAVVVEKTVHRVHRSRGQAKMGDLRKKTWDEINSGVLAVEGQKAVKARKADAEQDAVDKFFEDTDEEMEEVASGDDNEENKRAGEAGSGATASETEATAVLVPVLESPPPPPAEDEDEIL